MDAINLLKAMIFVQLFYAIGIGALVYSMPSDAIQYISIISNDGKPTLDVDTISGKVQENLERQTNIPVIDLGALVFYSGNFMIDLLLNFFFAIPQMLGFLIAAITSIFNFNPYLSTMVTTMFQVLFGVLYTIGIISLLLSLRSGRTSVG